MSALVALLAAAAAAGAACPAAFPYPTKKGNQGNDWIGVGCYTEAKWADRGSGPCGSWCVNDYAWWQQFKCTSRVLWGTVCSCGQLCPGVPVPTQCPGATMGPTGSAGTTQLAPVAVNGATAITGQGLDLVRIPPVFAQATAFFPQLVVPQQTEFALTCCGNSGNCCSGALQCDFWVSIYQCKGCSAPINGDLPARLVASGWDAASCAPQFIENGVHHPMATFHLRVNQGETVVLPETLRPTAHMVIFAKEGGVPLPWCPIRGPALPGTGSTCSANCAGK